MDLCVCNHCGVGHRDAPAGCYARAPGLSELGNPANFGSIVELESAELAAILDLSLQPVALSKQPAGLKVEARSPYLDASVPLKTEIYRMAAHIAHRAAGSGQPWLICSARCWPFTASVTGPRGG